MIIGQGSKGRRQRFPFWQGQRLTKAVMLVAHCEARSSVIRPASYSGTNQLLAGRETVLALACKNEYSALQALVYFSYNRYRTFQKSTKSLRFVESRYTFWEFNNHSIINDSSPVLLIHPSTMSVFQLTLSSTRFFPFAPLLFLFSMTNFVSLYSWYNSSSPSSFPFS